jgi:tetratricopeptide (TPR) repeat protein
MNSESSQSLQDPADVRTETADDHGRRWPSRLGGLIMIVLIAATLLGPILYKVIPGEAVKWRVAKAQLQWLEGDLQKALRTLDVAAVEFPESEAVYQQRIAFLLEDEDYGNALSDCNRLVEAAPKSPRNLLLRSSIFHHLGRHQEAIEDCREVLRLREEERIGDRVFALNVLAYAQALGKVDLQDALENVETAIDESFPRPAFLDTRGYIQYLLGNLQQAEEDMDQAVLVWEQYVAEKKASGLVGVRTFQVETGNRGDKQSAAVMRYHRALVYEALGKTEQARADRERVRELGYEPNDSLF